MSMHMVYILILTYYIYIYILYIYIYNINSILYLLYIHKLMHCSYIDCFYSSVYTVYTYMVYGIYIHIHISNYTIYCTAFATQDVILNLFYYILWCNKYELLET
jgi:hypothetical protein